MAIGCHAQQKKTVQNTNKEPTAEELYEKGMELVELENQKEDNLNVRDYTDAIYWLRNAADLGNCEAMKK